MHKKLLANFRAGSTEGEEHESLQVAPQNWHQGHGNVSDLSSAKSQRLLPRKPARQGWITWMPVQLFFKINRVSVPSLLCFVDFSQAVTYKLCEVSTWNWMLLCFPRCKEMGGPKTPLPITFLSFPKACPCVSAPRIFWKVFKIFLCYVQSPNAGVFIYPTSAFFLSLSSWTQLLFAKPSKMLPTQLI